MPCNGIHESLETAIQEKMLLFLYFSINDNDTFLENILGIIRCSAIINNKVMYGWIIVLIDILQDAVISGLYPLYDFLDRKFTHNIACSGVLRHKTKKKTLSAWISNDIFDTQGGVERHYITWYGSITDCFSTK
jgi:hypothetical protein